jgi:hypothetical protein
MTSFSKVYDRFLGKITDDMYLEWTIDDTKADCYNILMDAIPLFEFPRFAIYDFNDDYFNADLTEEEINILANLMMNTWLQRQLVSIENTRMKYGGSDMKLTSQANHLNKLISLKEQAEKTDKHAQRLYRRRKGTRDGHIQSNWSVLRKSAIDD